jgi:hypothetical protein
MAAQKAGKAPLVADNDEKTNVRKYEKLTATSADKKGAEVSPAAVDSESPP